MVGERGEWVNGQILILSEPKQEEKDSEKATKFF